MVKEDKLMQGEKSLGQVKETLTKITSFVQTDGGLQGLPGIKDLSSQLGVLSKLTENLKLDGLVDKVKSIFGVLGQLTNKIQEAAGATKGDSEGLSIG